MFKVSLALKLVSSHCFPISCTNYFHHLELIIISRGLPSYKLAVFCDSASVVVFVPLR